MNSFLCQISHLPLFERARKGAAEAEHKRMIKNPVNQNFILSNNGFSGQLANQPTSQLTN